MRRSSARTGVGTLRLRLRCGGSATARKQPAQFQRTDAEDLLSTVFPDQLACAENLPGGDREIPDHPLVVQTLADCLTAAMDIDGVERLLKRIEAGEVEVLCRELTSPSPLAQEILGAKPYAFLDDAPAEERRTLAVQTRRFMNAEQAAELGQLDPQAIERVRLEAWPDASNPDELHDALVLLGFVTAAEGEHGAGKRRSRDLRADGRATTVEIAGAGTAWVSAERLAELKLALPRAVAAERLAALDDAPRDADTALRELVRSRLEALGPVNAEALAQPFGLRAQDVLPALAALEQQGSAMRGNFTGATTPSGGPAEEWCERRLLARIHRYTLKRLRSEIEPATLADYQRFLLHWQGLGDERREGREALAAVLGELQGLTLPAALWEREVLPARIEDYGPHLLDQLCAAGEVVWWRPRPNGAAPPGRASTVATSPIAIVPRAALPSWRALGSADWAEQGLSGAAERVATALRDARRVVLRRDRAGERPAARAGGGGARRARRARHRHGGLVPRIACGAHAAEPPPRLPRPRAAARRCGVRRGRPLGPARDPRAACGPRVRRRPAGRAEAVEHAAKALLRRYGVVCRALLARETLAPSWRELLPFYRSAEARGEIRGGRFVEPLGGEQFALIEAVEELRRLRRTKGADEWLVLSAADPLNLSNLVAALPRVPARRAGGSCSRTARRSRRDQRGIDWRAELPRRSSASRGPARSGPAAAVAAPRLGWRRR